MTEATRLACEKPTTKYPQGRTGTDAGYQAHRQAGEKSCEACKEAVTAAAAIRCGSTRRPAPRIPDCHPDRKHVAHGFCNPCYEASRRPERPPKPPAGLACEGPTSRYPDGRTGTESGHSAHKRAGENPCGPCRLAHCHRKAINDRSCLVEDCAEPHNAHGYCKKHGFRVIRRGDPLDPGAFTYSETGLCTYPGCHEPHLAKGYCNKHYQRAKAGKLDLPETLTCERCGRDFPRPYKSNPDAVRYCSHECRYAVQLEGHKANRAERTAYLKEWAQNNPEKILANRLRRDAAERAANACLVTGRDLARLVRRYRGVCAYCGTRPYEHFDHVIPLIRGGRHSVGNLLPACAPCNLTKGPRLLADWRHRPPLPKRFKRSVSLAVTARPVA